MIIIKDILVTYNKDREIITKGDSWVYTDSLNLGDILNQRHDRILGRVRKILKDYNLEDSHLNWESSEVTENTEFINNNTDFTYSIAYYKNSQNKLQPYYKLSKDLLVLVIFSFRKLPKAQELQKAYIAQFNAMEKELQWHRARYLGIDVRNDLTETINKYLENPMWFIYKHFTDLVYKSLYGESCKKIRERHGLGKKENIRPYLEEDDLKKVEEREQEVSLLITYGFDYKKIKKMISNKYDGEKEKLTLREEKRIA